MKTIKIEVEETSRTDLLCVRCGGFRTEFAVRESDHVGVHTRCLREARPPSAVCGRKIDLDDEGELHVSVDGPVQRPKRARSMKPVVVPIEDESPLDREERELRHALDLAAD